MNTIAGRMMMVAWLLGTVTLAALWYLTPDTTIRIETVEAGQTVDIVGLSSYDGLSGGIVLADGSYQVAAPFTFEIPSRIVGHHQVEFRGGPGAPVLVAVSDKLGQTYRGRGERVVVWQGPLASGGISSGHLRTVLRNP